MSDAPPDSSPASRRDFIVRASLALGLLTLLPSRLLAQAADRVHIVKAGDTLSAIARAHGVSVQAIQTRNKLASARIVVGQRLHIPAAANSAPAPAAAGVLAPVLAASSGIRVEPGRWTHLVVHHSGIEAGNAKAYDSTHRRRGMENGLAYHFVIGNGRDSADGLIEVGPRWRGQLDGGHVRNRSMNQHGIGICLVGNFENRAPGARQLASLHALLEHFRGRGLPGSKPAQVTVHRWVDRNHTVCPGRRFPYADLRNRYGAAPRP